MKDQDDNPDIGNALADLTIDQAAEMLGGNDLEEDNVALEDEAEVDELEETEAEAEEDEAEDQDEDYEADDEDEATEEEADEDEDAQDYATQEALVVLPDGTESTVADLIQGQMRQSDYTRKTTEISQIRTKAETNAQRVAAVAERVTKGLTDLIPEEPTPPVFSGDSDAYLNAQSEYNILVQQRKNVQALVESFISHKEEAQGALQEISDAQRLEYEASQSARLNEMHPQTKTPAGMQKFMKGARDAALQSGITNEEFNGVRDARILNLLHLASQGLQAKHVKSKAKAKLQRVKPKAAPKKASQPEAVQTSRKRKAALDRLAQDDSIEAAINAYGALR